MLAAARRGSAPADRRRRAVGSVGPVAAEVCSMRSLAAGEPLVGTAVTEGRWLLVEQPGPWPARLAGDVAARCAQLGIRLQLLRRSVAREPAGRARECFLAATTGGPWWIERHVVREAPDVLALPLAALAEGRSTDPAARWDGDLYVVCAHGERDPCCARLGRPLHRALLAARPRQTWQTSHLGGHRFAATMVHFPSGVCLGRVPAARARAIADALEAGRIPVELLRGRVGHPWAAQAAEGLVRAQRGLEAHDAVTVVGVEGETVTLQVGGEPLQVTVGREPLRAQRPASCGKAPEPADRPVLPAGSGSGWAAPMPAPPTGAPRGPGAAPPVAPPPPSPGGPAGAPPSSPG